MPIYTFECKNAHAFEKLVSHQDAESQKRFRCPECKSLAKRSFMADATAVNSTQSKDDGYRPRKRYTNW